MRRDHLDPHPRHDGPLDADDVTVRQAVHDAYPSGERKHHPYTAWRQAVKDWTAERAKLRAWQGVGAWQGGGR